MEKKNRDNKIDFVWYLKSSGYYWAKGSNVLGVLVDYSTYTKNYTDMGADDYFKKVKEGYSPEALYLIGNSLASEVKAYRPLDDMALFANFAEIETALDDFITWSGKYGPLSIKEPFFCSNLESKDFWVERHRVLGFVLLIWELAVKKDTEKLKNIICWTDNNTAVKVNHIERKFIEGVGAEYPDDPDYIKRHTFQEAAVLFDKNNTRSWFSNLCGYPDVIRPALFYVQTVISQMLKEYPLNVEIKSDELDGKLYTTLRPTSLLSAMWYQFFLVFTGEEQIRRCELCGKWEDMRGHRSSWKAHKTCASNERVKRFRKNGGD